MCLSIYKKKMHFINPMILLNSNLLPDKNSTNFKVNNFFSRYKFINGAYIMHPYLVKII